MRTKLLLTGIAVLFLATGTAHARPREMICSGDWVDMRAIGLNIGKCDVNSVSDDDLKIIKNACAEPWDPTSDQESTQCQIRALVVPFKNQRGAEAFKVLRVYRASILSRRSRE